MSIFAEIQFPKAKRPFCPGSCCMRLLYREQYWYDSSVKTTWRSSGKLAKYMLGQEDLDLENLTYALSFSSHSSSLSHASDL